MRATLRQLLALFDRRTKRRFAVLLLPIAGISALELLSLGVLLPVLQIMTDIGRITTLPVISDVYAFFGSPSPETFVLAGVGIVGALFVLKNLALMALVHSQNRFVARRMTYFMAELFGFYVRRPYSFFLDHNTAEIQRNLVQAASSVFNNGVLGIIRIVHEAAVAAAIMALLFIVNPILALFVGAVMGLAMWVLNRVMAPHLMRWGERNNALGREILQAASQAMGAIKEIKLLGREAYFIRSFADQAAELCLWQSHLQTYSAMPRILVETLGVAIFASALVVLFLLGLDTREILPLIGVYGAAAIRLMPSFNRILQYSAQINTASGAIAGLHEHLVTIRRSEPDVVVSPDGGGQRGPFHEIRFESVGFRYRDGNRLALSGITTEIRCGDYIGLVGASGAGKSTFADVLLGLLIPDTGHVLVDGRDISEDLGAWRSKVGYVPQTIYLCDDSLRGNIALGIAPRAIDENRLQAAVQRAHLSAVVSQLPGGLESIVGERGVRLSGGQRQRIGIARALYHDPDLLVLDEATSALDAASENEIADTLEALGRDKTIIVIAHRLGTIRRCRQLVFLENGRIDDSGSFDELLARNRGFQRLVAATDTLSR